jgi:peptide/nickel transport system ATP-binding protein
MSGAAKIEPALRVNGLHAYYQTRYFGVEREVRAVDGIDLAVQADEIYGWPGNRAQARPP